MYRYKLLVKKWLPRLVMILMLAIGMLAWIDNINWVNARNIQIERKRG